MCPLAQQMTNLLGMSGMPQALHSGTPSQPSRQYGVLFVLQERRTPEPMLPLDPLMTMVSSRASYRALQWGTMNSVGFQAQIGLMDYGILNTLQVDQHGNINSPAIGEYGERAAFEYRFRRDRVDQFDFRLSWPLSPEWRVLTRVNYSFDDDDLLETQAGFEYESCCWALRTVYRRYLKNRVGEHRDGIYLELNLKGLASVGTGDELFPN